MVKVKFISKTKGTDSTFPDECNVNSLKNAEEEIKEVIKEFNEEEKRRYGDTARLREFVKLVVNVEAIPQHDWNKKDLVSGAYTNYECKKCRLIVNVHSFDVPTGGNCYPDRVCVDCNKVFKTAKNLERHLKRHEE